MKLVFCLMALLGLGILVFSVATHLEFQAVTTSEKPPTEADVRLTRIIAPEIVAPAAEGETPKPAELARDVVGKIYAFGAMGMFLLLAGIVGMLWRRKTANPKS